MPEVNLTSEEMASINRLSQALAENEQLRERIGSDPQGVLREFGLDGLAKGMRPGSGISVPNVIAFAAREEREGHTDWVPHWDHSDSHSDSWGPIIISPR
jgi:hypothetical protein